jgi:Tfp pilus assembly protein PilF
VFNDQGLCLARQGKLQEAERALARAVQLQPAKPLYRNNIAKVLVELNCIDAAGSNLAAVHPLPIVNYNLGVMLRERGRNAEAERYLTAALRMDPNMAPAQALLAELRPMAPAYRTARVTAPVVAASSVAAPVIAPQSATMPTPALQASPTPTAPNAAAPTPTLLPPVN